MKHYQLRTVYLFLKEWLLGYDILLHLYLKKKNFENDIVLHVGSLASRTRCSFLYFYLIIIIIITSHRLITRWGRLRLLLGSTCSQFLSSFSFYRRRYLHPFPSNILTNDVFSMVRISHSRQLSR